MPIYQNSIIYKIKHNDDYDDTNIYVGSTTNFRIRKNQHKSDCNNEKCKQYIYRVYQYIRDNGNWDNFVMIPIEEYPCNSKKELEIRERYHIDLLRPALNRTIPCRTKKEHYEDNKEQISEQKKQYYEANKEYFNEKKKKWYEDNKEQISKNKKEYYEDNKELILEYSKEYRNANKEKINEKQNEKVICDHCGCYSTKTNLKRHQQTKKCINYVKT